MIRLLLILILVTRLSYSLTISPPIVNVVLDNNIAKEIEVSNDSDKPKRYRVEVVEDSRYTDYSLKDSLRIFPQIISLLPREEKSIRIRIVPKKSISSGEYKTYIVLKEIPVKSEFNNGNSEKNTNEEYGVKIETLLNTWISIYGEYGEVDKSLNIDKVIDENKIISRIKSIGNGGLRIWSNITIVDSNGSQRIVEKPIARVMRGEYLEVITSVDLDIGERIMDIVYMDSEKKIIY